MSTYTVNDGHAPIDIEARSMEQAAVQYVAGGDWADPDSPVVVAVTAPDGKREHYEMTPRESI